MKAKLKAIWKILRKEQFVLITANCGITDINWNTKTLSDADTLLSFGKNYLLILNKKNE